VATATFSAIWIDHVLRCVRAPTALRAANALWCFAIVYSTLATKQHVLIDVLAGFTLALPFAWLSLRSRPATNGQRL
jgi:membrane-associated phospholipid phosphatase